MFRLLIGILRNRILWLLVVTACVGLNCQRRPQAAVAANDGLMRFALQIGIDEYQYVTALDGCVQDILDMKPVLINKFGFPEANIQTLTNKQATHAAIVEAFKTHLIGNAKKHPNAIVVFQYSGHGSQTDDGNGDESDQLDETLVSVDSRDPQNKVFDITDDELNGLFEQLSQHTSNITFILDSCHSGSATRGETKVRRVPNDRRPQPRQSPLRKTRSSSQARDSERVDILPPNQRYVTISGSRSTEVSNERRERFALKTNGAMTFHLLKALQRAKPETTYRELMEEVARAVTLEFPAQHPQFEGDIRRSVFGGSANREDPFIRISAVKGNTITLEAGTAQGIKEGTPIAIYAPDAQRLSGPEKNLAIATVTKVAALTSTAETREPVAIPANAKAVLMSPNYGTAKLRLALDASRVGDASASFVADIKEELKRNNGIEVVNSPRTSDTTAAGSSGWDVALFAGKFGEVFTDKDGIAPAAAEDAALPADDAKVFYLAATDGIPLFGFFVTENDTRGPQKISEALDRLARIRALKALTNEARGGGQGIRITPIRVFGRTIEGKFTPERDEIASTGELDFDFDQGEHFKFKIENQSGKDMYITVFDLGTDGSIQLHYPPEGAGVLLKNGDQITTQNVYETTGPAGYETFKIIATTDQRDFTFLTLNALRRDGKSPFQMLMDTALRPRAKLTKVASVDDWMTSQIDFVISDKKKP